MKRFRTILAAFVLTVIAGTSSMLAQTSDTIQEATGPVKMFGVPVTLPYKEFKAAVEQSPEYIAFKNYVKQNFDGVEDFNVYKGWVVDCSKSIGFDTSNNVKALKTLECFLTLKYGTPKEKHLATMVNNLVDRRGMVASSIGINATNTICYYWEIPGGEIILTNLRNDMIYLDYIDYDRAKQISAQFISGL